MTEWIDVPQVAKELNIPDRTLRRYMERHSLFVQSRKEGRYWQIARSSLPVLSQIRDLYSAGLTADQVDTELRAQMSLATVEVGGKPATMAELVAAMTDELERLRREVTELRNELAATRQAQERQAERLEERDRALMTTLRAIQERQRPWWERLTRWRKEG